MEKSLTVVIPMYNIEKYIRECLDSFCIPELMKNIEVLIIDDGSQDRSAKIAEEFQTKYPETFRVIHKENGGHGSTINRGIQEASGKYFKVVDGDDWVNQDALKRLVESLQRNHSDIVCSDFKWVFDKSGREKVGVSQPFPKVIYGKEYSFTDICGELYIKMHSMTIKTQILKEHFIPLDEHCFYVDWEYTAYPIPYVSSIMFIPDCVYMYRVGREGQSVNIQNMQKNIKHHLTVLRSLMAFYKRQYGCSMNGLDRESQKKAEYLAQLIGRVVASQTKIYLSFPISRQNKQRLIKFDEKVKKQNPVIYDHVQNRSVWLLRKSNFRLYAIAAYLVKMRKQ
ncbi:glycosyltransferase family 2 protein [Lachnospiraceae bacterium 62-35]